MLLTNRRHRLIFASLAALDMAGLLPWLALLTNWWASGGDPLSLRAIGLLVNAPLAAFLLLWTIQLAFVLVGDLINRYAIASPLREGIIFLLIVVTALLAVRMMLYPTLPLADLRWLRATFTAVFDFTNALRGELIVVLTAFFLWARVARYTDRGMTFFAVGVTFRLGLLLAIVANAALTELAPDGLSAAAVYFALFMVFGLLAVALARIDQKAVGAANSSGALLPWSRVTQLLVAIGIVLGVGWIAAAIFTPALLRTVLGWFGPVGAVFQWLLVQFVFLFFWVFGPILEALATYLAGIIAEIPAQEPSEIAPPVEPVTITTLVREWALLRYCLVTAAIVLVLGLIWLFFVRTRLYNRRNEEEETVNEEASRQPGRLSLNLDRLKAWLGLVGRYGVGRRLLAAISVENMYANLVRMARRRGYPRPPALPPERFLPTLDHAFPGRSENLATITRAYLSVRYGEHPAQAEELAEIRAAYTRIVEQADNEPEDGEQHRPTPSS